MNSDSNANGGSTSKTNTSLGSRESRTDRNQPALIRSKKEKDLTISLAQSLLNATNENQGRSRSRAPSAALSFHIKERRNQSSTPINTIISDQTPDEDGVVTLAAPRMRFDEGELSPESSTEDMLNIGMLLDRNSDNFTNQVYSGPHLPFLNMVNNGEFVPNIHVRRDRTVDMSDLELSREIFDMVPAIHHSNHDSIRKSEGNTDFTQVIDFPVEELYNGSQNDLRVLSPRLSDDLIGNSSEVEIRTIEPDAESSNLSSSESNVSFADLNCGSISNLLIMKRDHKYDFSRLSVSHVRSTEEFSDFAAHTGQSNLDVYETHSDPLLRHATTSDNIPEDEAQAYNQGSAETLMRVINVTNSLHMNTLEERKQSLQFVSTMQSESLNIPKKVSSGSDNDSHPSSLFGNEDFQRPLLLTNSSADTQPSPNGFKGANDDKQVNFLLSMSKVDIVYNAPDQGEGQEESSINPGIESRMFSLENSTAEPPSTQRTWKVSEMKYILSPEKSKIGREESINNLDRLPCSPPLIQTYVADRKNRPNVSATSSAGEAEVIPIHERKSLEHSDSEPSNASSSSEAESMSFFETLQHTGSVQLMENLPGLDGQHGQFDKPCSLPTAQELLDAEDEMLSLATRSKFNDPPLDLRLYQWESIVKILGLNEPLAVQQVLCTLSKMTSKRFHDLVQFYKYGLYGHLINLLLQVNHTETTLIQNLTLKLIAELSVLPDCRVNILQCHHLVFRCIILLKDDNSSRHLHECTSKIIAAIAEDNSIQLSLFHEHEMMEVLLQRINKSSDPDIRCHCIEIILRLVSNETGCKFFVMSEHFTLQLFHVLLNSKFAKIQQLGLGLLVLVTKFETEQAFQERVHESGLAEKMITILETESMTDFSHLVIAILCNIGNTKFGLNFLQTTGAIKFLVDYIDTVGKEDLLGCGLDLIVKLSVSRNGRQFLLESDVPTRLVKYLKREDNTTLERACVAIANMSENLGAVIAMVTERPAEDLIRLIFEDRSSLLKYAASRAIFELAARDKTMCLHIAEAHLPEVFHHIIWSGFAHLQTLTKISNTIQIISHYPALKEYMITEEIMACFLDIIQGHCRQTEISAEDLENDEALRVAGLQCLQCYMSEPDCRVLFLGASGMYVLRNIVQSSSIPIRQASALFIELAAKDPTLATEMVVAGLIPIMRSDTSMTAVCPAWQRALQQIYNSHLPSKFAYCNRLDISDVTAEGFYIAATRRGRIEVLENLRRDKACPLETIYVCNFAIEQPGPENSVRNIISPKWEPDTNLKNCTYPPALKALGERSLARMWRHKVSLLYGNMIPDQISDNASMLLSPHDSPSTSSTTGRQELTRNGTSGRNRRPKARKTNIQGRSLTSVETFHLLPKVYELKASWENFGASPFDEDLTMYLRDLNIELEENMGNNDENDEDPQNLSKLVKLVQTLARFVNKRMSGNMNANMDSLKNFFHVSVWELKERDGTNVLPLGHLKAGLYLERALLFKILADKIGLPCTLVRGEYGIAFNEISIPCLNNDFPIHWESSTPNYVVDLMQNVGEMYFLESQEAFNYCNIPY